MTADDTKQRILDAAERLFAEQGFDATSLRAVTAAAGTNLAAVNYHFGAKAALLPAVIGRILEPVCARQVQLLDDLEARSEPPAVEDLLEAFTGPIIELFQPGDRGPTLARLFARIMGDPGDSMQRMALGQVREAERRYAQAFARALPHVPSPELWWRLRSIGPVTVSRQMRAHLPAELGGPPTAAERDREALRRYTITYLAAALRAPATGEGEPASLPAAEPALVRG
jgi:AcrR family transcriptional regulator